REALVAASARKTPDLFSGVTKPAFSPAPNIAVKRRKLNPTAVGITVDRRDHRLWETLDGLPSRQPSDLGERREIGALHLLEIGASRKGAFVTGKNNDAYRVVALGGDQFRTERAQQRLAEGIE